MLNVINKINLLYSYQIKNHISKCIIYFIYIYNNSAIYILYII